MDPRELTPELITLFMAVKDSKEMGILLNGLLTPGEIREIVFRWRLIALLLEKKPQREIAAELGVSLGKISRGSRLLQYGPPEFRGLVERLWRETQATDSDPRPTPRPSP
ncbi:MAG: transcriptional regulator [Kiritimatiellaeota bacterium]|nr:transcriptional regulator [Kiritimatiellota bacterium]